MPEYQDKGRYVGKIIGQGISKSREKQTPCVVIEFQVVAQITGPTTEVDVTNQYRRTCTIWLTEKTEEYATRDLATLGFTDFYTLDQINIGHPDCISLIGKEAQFYCRHEAAKDGSGKVYERWSVAFTPESEVEYLPVDRSELRRLDALFAKGKKRSASGPTVQRTPAPAATEGAGITDDDIPF
jgi:hypothetical protein